MKKQRHFDFSRPIVKPMSCTGIHLRFCPDHTQSIAFLKDRQNTDCYNKDIYVIGFYYDRFVSLCYSVFGVQEDARIGLFVVSWCKFFKTARIVTNNNVFPSNNNCILVAHFSNFVTQKVKQLSLVVIIPKKLFQCGGILPLYSSHISL